ncbi:phage terminase small subunit P27 family [Tetragenococcus halophilus]|uniref:phage terminase small subunit P27 family n=1 Tax=Tetragenococcus halophilus TaxID=51669 RepID=UPI002A9A4CCB|nr:hypothetical protein TEHSL10_11590 [Tetragenococcus halophilus]
MARPRKLNDAKQGHRTKAELEAAELQENTLNAYDQINVDDIPEDLNEIARKEWLRIVPLLSQLPIAELDMVMVKNYCQLVGMQEEAYRDIQRVGTYDPSENKRTGPYLIYMDCHKELKSVCNKLGLTIDSRMRIVVPTENTEKQSIYDEFGVDDDD